MSQDRREEVKRVIQAKGEVALKQLEEMFPKLSSMTLRRDLAFLEDKGFIKRIRGGAIAVERLYNNLQEDVYSLRAARNIEHKMLIARKAVPFAELGRSIFIDSGSTMMCLAKALPDESYTILTSGPNIALELIKNLRPTVMLLGGQLSGMTLSASGVHALEFLERFNIDIAFMATSGYTREGGFTSGIYNESELKRLVIQKARRKIMLMDSSKLDRSLPFTFAQMQQFDVLVGDDQMPASVSDYARGFGVTVY